MTDREIRLGVGDGSAVFFGDPATGRETRIDESPEGFRLTVREKGREVSPTPEEICGAGQLLWDRGIRNNPADLIWGGASHPVLFSSREGVLTAVTAPVGTVEFSPRRIPLRFETPLINDPVTVEGETFRLTAVGFGDPYAVVFLEKAADFRLIARGGQISSLQIFPGGAEVLFAYAQGERKLHLRPFHRDGDPSLRGRDLVAGVGAAVALGLCLPGRSVTVPLARGEGRAVCDRDRNFHLTMPVFADFA